METKKLDFRVMSDKVCYVCGLPLKQNVIKRNPQANKCYVCWQLGKGVTKIRQNKVIDGEKVLVKEIDLIKVQTNNIRRFKNNSKSIYISNSCKIPSDI
jgi:hypothetical protein